VPTEQATPATATEAMEASGPGDEAPPLPTAGAARLAELVKQRATAATVASTTVEPAAIVEDPVATQSVAAMVNPAEDRTTKSGPQTGLRQLLQMMAPQASAPAAEAADSSPAARVAPAPATYATQAELIRRAADLVSGAAPAASAAKSPESSATPAPVQPTTTTTVPDATLAAANLAAPAQPSRPAFPAAEQATLQAPVGTPRWADELGARVALMSLRGQHEGSLNLTPEHLGPLEVRVSVNQNTANVWFGSQHADTRAALAEAMPRLRELMAGAGINLGQTSVSHQAPRQGSREGDVARIGAARAGTPVDGVESATPAVARRIALGLVDTYA